MYIFFAAVAFAVVTNLGSDTTTISFSDSKACEICSSCMDDLGFLDTPSKPTFGTTPSCVDYCVDCYGSGRKSYIDCTTDSLTVDF